MSKEVGLDKAKQKAPKAVDLDKNLSEIESGSREVGVFADQQRKTDKDTQQVSSHDLPVAAPKKRRRLVLGGLVAAFCLVLAIGVGTFAMWYQKPDKVVLDALLGALQAETLKASGDYTLSGGSTQVRGAYVLESGRSAGLSLETDATVKMSDDDELTFKTSFIGAQNGDLYVKFDNAQALYEAFAGQVASSLRSSAVEVQPDVRDALYGTFTNVYAPLAQKVDGRWIHVSASNLRSTNAALEKRQTCLQDLSRKLSDGNRFLSEIRRTYADYPFMKIEEIGEKNGAMGYAVSLNNKTVRQFLDGLTRTDVYRELSDCIDVRSIVKFLDQNREDSSDQYGSQTALRVWISRWRHQLQSLEAETINESEDVRTTVKLKADISFDGAVSVDTPKNPLALEGIMSDIGRSPVFRE